MRKILAHVIGFVLILGGWYLIIINVGLDRFSPTLIHSKTNLFGLGLILLGAYTPEIFHLISRNKN